MAHQFHIPVLGLAFSVDTPIKVAHLGITSVLSIVDDELLERMREFHATQAGLPYTPITKNSPDHRARRIEAYLNLVQFLVQGNFNRLRKGDFSTSGELHTYFELLPDLHPLKVEYLQMMAESDPTIRQGMQDTLRHNMSPGKIEVNIMSKVDKLNSDHLNRPLDEAFSDALSALRGVAHSALNLSLVLSAGMNPRLYTYLGELSQFQIHSSGPFKKEIILKVSDYRSALIQAKFLAKKRIWISEFRIESGLNCGGHAFATEGYLLGPILEEFKQKKAELVQELMTLYSKAWGLSIDEIDLPPTRFTVQGGIGTAEEQRFLLDQYELDGTGWGSPFLLVPEATTVDAETLQNLATAAHTDFYVSGASPLGVPFNNFRKSTAEKQRLERIKNGRPGSPCTKKYLVSNTEFTSEPICTASRKYQHRKIKQLQSAELQPEEYQRQLNDVLEKTCLCEGLASSAYLKNDLLKPKENPAVAICPGPNIAWFNRSYSLREMVDHIYGRIDLLVHAAERPNLFINELELYLQHLQKFIDQNNHSLNDKKEKYITKFKTQLEEGIRYYESLQDRFQPLSNLFSPRSLLQLEKAKLELQRMGY